MLCQELLKVIRQISSVAPDAGSGGILPPALTFGVKRIQDIARQNKLVLEWGPKKGPKVLIKYLESRWRKLIQNEDKVGMISDMDPSLFQRTIAAAPDKHMQFLTYKPQKGFGPVKNFQNKSFGPVRQTGGTFSSHSQRNKSVRSVAVSTKPE